MPKPLTISPAPFKSSYLSIPPSPFSPRLPLTPPATPPRSNDVAASSNKRELPSPSTPPPSPPLKWVWQCHICLYTYPLGTTRRCLSDGHFFCSGVSVDKSWRSSINPRQQKRKTKKHRACASEFDYAGWKAFGQWRRNEETFRKFSFDYDDDDDDNSHASSPRSTHLQPPGRDCWNRCNFPSECRWGSQYGDAQTTTACATPLLPAPSEELPSYSESQQPSSLTPLDTAAAATTTLPSSGYTPPTTFDGILEGRQEGELSPISPRSPKEARDRFWDGILDSARQRRRSKGHSPLALNPVVEETEPESPGLAGVSSQQRLFEAFDRWTLPGLTIMATDESAVRAPEQVVVLPGSSASAAGRGFDFGFAGAEEQEAWSAGTQQEKSDVGRGWKGLLKNSS